jgi:hypothetical protein
MQGEIEGREPRWRLCHILPPEGEPRTFLIQRSTVDFSYTHGFQRLVYCARFSVRSRPAAGYAVFGAGPTLGAAKTARG